MVFSAAAATAAMPPDTAPLAHQQLQLVLLLFPVPVLILVLVQLQLPVLILVFAIVLVLVRDVVSEPGQQQLLQVLPTVEAEAQEVCIGCLSAPRQV